MLAHTTGYALDAAHRDDVAALSERFGLPLPPLPLGIVRLLREARDHEPRCRRFRIQAWIESGRRGVEPACADAL